jgi:hypothetical protein
MSDETQGRTTRTALPVWVARDTRLRTERVPEHIRAVPDVLGAGRIARGSGTSRVLKIGLWGPVISSAVSG